MGPDPLSKPTFWDLKLGGSPITEIGIQLLAFRDENYDPMGSAVIIGTNLALTALHVIQDYWESFEQIPFEQSVSGSFHLSAIQRLEDGQRAILYDVKAFSYVPEIGDLVILRLQPSSPVPNDFKWRVPRITLTPPPIDSVVHAFGFRDARATVIEKGLNLHQRPTTSTGRVKEVYITGRDALLSFPCFQCNARFDGGMSGGPVFNHEGKLVGIICSNMPPYDEGEDHVSHVSLLWKLMGLTLNFPRFGHDPESSYTVQDLAKENFIIVEGWEKVSLKRDPNGIVVGVGIMPPSRTL